MIKTLHNILTISLFILLNLFQSVVGNTFIICKDNGFHQEIEVTSLHRAHDHSNENSSSHLDELLHGDLNDDDCNPCKDLYVENLSNTINIRGGYSPLLNYSISCFYKDLYQNTQAFNTCFEKSYNKLCNSSLYFPLTTVLII